eukprot:12973582-Ditylum_brightwellii.AAC.1
MEMPQEVQLVIGSNCVEEDSANLDNKNQDGQTYIIDDNDDNDHETRRETAAVSFEQADTKTSTYGYEEPKSYEEAWYHTDPKQHDKWQAAITKKFGNMAKE